MRPRPEAFVDLRLVVWPMALTALCELAAWGMLLDASQALLGGWFGHPGLLIATHLLTLGVLGLAIQSTGWQLVPVVTGAPPPTGWGRLAWLCNELYLLGLFGLLLGFRLGGPPLLIGASLILGALMLRSGVVVTVLLSAAGRGLTRAWLLSAELCLWAGLSLAGALTAARLGTPILPDHLAGMGSHAGLLLGGWIGGWILGLGGVLLPMFAVAPEPRRGPHALGLALWLPGLLLGNAGLWASGAAIAGVGLLDALRRRAKRRMEVAMMGAALGVVGLLVVTGVAWRAGMSVETVALGLCLWALPFLRGVALRVLPFLSWAHHLGAAPQSAPPVSALLPPLLAALSVAASLGAGAGVCLGLLARAPVALKLASGLGALGAAGFAVTLLIMTLRVRLFALRSERVPGMEAK
ncbi:MAG: hypothetical protein H6740_15035 [Alphaproteobacteria bacterium]|nr:hypothetical protein [Alphaproteobacteria bacterium]